MFARHDLDELVACDKQPAVSIYMPTHAAGREVRQDAIRLRNLLNTATKRLGADHRPPEIAELLDPARLLVDDEEFWRYQERGLAVFLAPGFHRVHKLPVEVAEELFVGAHFCIRPLLPLAHPEARFWVLTISAGRTRLYQGSRWSFDEFPGIELPQGVQEIYDETIFQEGFKAGPTGRPQRGAPTAMAKSQAVETPEDVRKAELLELLRRVKAAVEPVIKRQPAPVILVAHPEIQGHFRDIAKWKEMLPEGIQENPDALGSQELHRKACEFIAPREEKNRTDALGRLESMLGSGNNGKATTVPEEIVKAARYGRVDRLFLSDGEPLWGWFDEQHDRIVAHRDPAPGDDDLLDYAAVLTLRQGGNVMVVDRTQLPPTGPAAAILRY
jgi:Bacterial archaeo-eukaryotic release factor family 3